MESLSLAAAFDRYRACAAAARTNRAAIARVLSRCVSERVSEIELVSKRLMLWCHVRDSMPLSNIVTMNRMMRATLTWVFESWLHAKDQVTMNGECVEWM